MSKWNAWKRPKCLDASRTSLTFTDVIFGLVFTEIFMRASALSALSTAIDIHLALSLAVAVGSYIGYRGSLKRASYKLAFFNLPLIRFTLDLFMIFLYYVLTITPDETKNPSAAVNPRTDSLVILIIFAAYLAWDIVSLVMSEVGYTEIIFQLSRTAVTTVGLVAAGVMCLVAWMSSQPLNQHFAIIVDLTLMAVVILYRWAKDSVSPSVTSQSQLAVAAKAVSDSAKAVSDAATKLEEAMAAKPLT